jgi:CRP-like cAMP-binding protein
LLELLPTDERAWLTPRIERVTLKVGEILAEANEPYRHVYFPETCVLSFVNHMSGHEVGVEVGTIGKEGMAGLSVFLDAMAAPSMTLAQIPGEAARVDAHVFAAGTAHLPQLERRLRRYTHAFLTQVAQTAACNRMHAVQQRCARWLLMTHDRVGTDSFALTHRFLAFMLGVRRASVTDVASGLQRRGLIRYSRGVITIADRAGLEQASCDCYRIVHEHFDRLLGPGAEVQQA